jgi:hypothetical protein
VRFYAGDVVSRGQQTGLIVTLHRKVDQRPFLMVQVDGGGRAWPNDGWRLGAGNAETVCEICDRPFLYTPPLKDDLPWCDHCRATDQNRDPGRRASSYEQRQRRRLGMGDAILGGRKEPE